MSLRITPAPDRTAGLEEKQASLEKRLEERFWRNAEGVDSFLDPGSVLSPEESLEESVKKAGKGVRQQTEAEVSEYLSRILDED